MDVWQVTGEAGGELQISVDTVSADTAFDPWLFVVEPDGCTTAFADDNFDCTYPPPEYSCPAAAVSTEAGTYQIGVMAYNGSCAGGSAEYELSINADWDVELTNIADDVASHPYNSTQYSVNGCADVYAEGEDAPGTPCVPPDHGLGGSGGDDTGGGDTGGGGGDTGTGTPDTGGAPVEAE